MSRGRARGAFYAEAIRFRVTPDGDVIRIGVQVGRQLPTAKAAARALEEHNDSGYITAWSDREQRRHVVADRDSAGRWTSTDPFTGERVEVTL